jgi:hypothetical protein
LVYFLPILINYIQIKMYEPFTPKTRIEKLKQEIRHLDERLTTEHNPPLMQLPPQLKLLPIPNVQTKERDLIEAKIRTLSSSIQPREEDVSEQLAEVSFKLTQVLQEQQREKLNSQQFKERFQARIESQKDELETLQQEYNLLSGELSSLHRTRKAQRQEKSKKFSLILGPLEKVAWDISKQKTEHSAALTRAIESKIATERCILMTNEEIAGRYLQRAEYIAHREELEAVLSEFLQDNSEALKWVTKEFEINDELLKIKKRKEAQVEKIKDIEVRIIEIKNVLETVNDNCLEITENNLRDKCLDVGIDTLGDVIMDINTLHGFDIDEEIVKLQMCKVAEAKNEIRTKFVKREAEIKAQIKRYESIYSSDNEFSISIQIESLKEDLEKEKRWVTCQIGAIDQWLEEAHMALSSTDIIQRYTASDEEILTEIKFKIGSRVKDAHFSIELDDYIKRLQAKATTDSLVKKCEELEDEKLKLRKDLMKIIVEEKNLSRELDEVKKKLRLSDYETLELTNQLEKIRYEVAFFDKLIENETVLIEKILKADLNSGQDRIKEDAIQIANFKVQLESLNQSEFNTNRKIESILEKQREEMLYSLEEIKTKTDEFHAARLNDLKEEIAHKANLLEIIRKDMESFELESQVKLMELEREESSLKTLKYALERNMKEIEQDKQQLAQLERRLIELGGKDSLSSATSNMRFSSRSRSMPKANRFSNKSLSPITRDLIPQEFQDIDESTNFTNPYLDLVANTLHKPVQIPQDRKTLGRSLYGTLGKKFSNIGLDDPSHSDKNIFERIAPILEGGELYKKFSQRSSLKQKVFDPLEKYSPESCGYGIRYFRLNRALDRVDIKQPLKSGVDNCILIDSIHAPIIPQQTLDIIKVQRRGETSDGLDEEDYKYEEMKERGLLNPNSLVFQSRAKACNFYPFSIALKEGGRIELVAKGYNTFKKWIEGINTLVKNRKCLPRLRIMLEKSSNH